MKCYLKDKMLTPCKGKVIRRFTGGDEAVLCSHHWRESIKAMKEVHVSIKPITKALIGKRKK